MGTRRARLSFAPRDTSQDRAKKGQGPTPARLAQHPRERADTPRAKEASRQREREAHRERGERLESPPPPEGDGKIGEPNPTNTNFRASNTGYRTHPQAHTRASGQNEGDGEGANSSMQKHGPCQPAPSNHHSRVRCAHSDMTGPNEPQPQAC